VSLDLNPGLIVVFGPVLALLLLISLKIEADTLVVAREVVLPKMSHLDPAATKASRWVFPLFVVPCAAATFMTCNSSSTSCRSKPGCAGYVWTRKFTDFLAPGRFAIDLLHS